MTTTVFQSDKRPFGQVPKPVVLLFILALTMQLAWHHRAPAPQANGEALPSAPAAEWLNLASLGDPVALSKFLNLWLQVFDNQPGISIPFRDLDYGKVRGWLQASLALDPRGHYPLLAATRLYGEIPDSKRQRYMLEFAYEKFLEAPNERWQWMAHAVLVARHRLDDLPLALKYAEALAANATGSQVPHWATQMAIFVLEDMGETEAAEVLIGGLLESGRITDTHELRFLTERLDALKGTGAPTGK